MLSNEQFDKARQFIFRQGRLIDRKRFLYHFADGPRDAVVQVLACYQNPDGGFGHGLELDVMCPASTLVCTELAMFYLDELGVTTGPIVDRIEGWISPAIIENRVPYPADDVMAYPHGEWWEGDAGNPLSIVGMLGKWGRGSDRLFECAKALFRQAPAGDEVGVYQYPQYLYLRHAPGAEELADRLAAIRGGLPGMLEKFAWHCPLFFHPFGWVGDDIDANTMATEADKAVHTLQDDGGVRVEQYEKIASYPVWRAVWTLDMLVTMKAHGLLAGRS